VRLKLKLEFSQPRRISREQLECFGTLKQEFVLESQTVLKAPPLSALVLAPVLRKHIPT